MKRFLPLVLLIIPALVWGASQTEMTTMTEKPLIEITKVFYIGDASDYPELKKEYMEAFSDEFGVELKVNTFPRNEYMDKLNLMITSKQLSGLVLPFFHSDYLEARENGVIYALDDFLKDNATWKKMPKPFREAWVFFDETWAVANGWYGAPFARTVRKDWLDNLGMDVPTNTDELYEMAKRFTEDDPDGNGKDDTVGITASGTWNLQDIFQAFDAKLMWFGADPIAWDPQPNAYVDTMLKPEMLEALEYLADMYRNGYLDQEVFTNKGSTMREKMWSGKYGSTFYWLNWGTQQFLTPLHKNVPEGEAAYIMALEGNRTKQINHVAVGGPGYMMLKTTQNPKEMINAFVDTFLGDDRAMLWGNLGIEGKMFRMDGNLGIRLNDPATGSLFPNPGLSNNNPLWPRGKYTWLPEGTPEAMKTQAALIALEEELTTKALEDGVLYDVPGVLGTYISSTYNEIIGDIRKIFDEAIVKVITGEISAREGQQLYLRQAKAIGAQKILDECNDFVGMTAPAWSRY